MSQNGIFNWNAAERGLILGCYYYGYTISNVPGGWLAQKLGFKLVMGTSMFVSGLMTLAMPFAAYLNIETFVILRTLIGFFQVIVQY